MRQYIIASVLIIIGLLSMFINSYLNNAYQFLSDFSSAILVSGLLSFLFKIFQDKETESTLRRLLRIHDSVDELGLIEIKADVQSFNYSELIKESNKLDVVMNDGQRWIGNNTVALEERFSQKTETNFFTVNPESEFIKVLAIKTGMAEGDLKKKIEDSWKRIEDAFEKSSKQGTLSIYTLKTYPTKSVFISENILVETPYQISSGRVKIPVYIYKKVARTDSPYWFVHNDVEEMKKESILIKCFGNSGI